MHHLTLSGASQAWDQLAERVDVLITAWESSGRPPELARLLPEGPAALRRMVMGELIKVDLEYRWEKFGPHKTIEQYLAEFPELTEGGGIPYDLIFEEYHTRRRAGDDVDVAQYRRRFPEHASELARLLDSADPMATTSLYSSERIQELQVGQRIDDFDLVAPLGKGSFATVFLARQISMQRLVALKISSGRGMEPQTLAQLDHPNIVRVFDQRSLEGDKLRLLYMEHVAGGTLGSVVSRLRATPAGEWNGRLLLEVVDASLVQNAQSPPVDSEQRRKLVDADWGQVVCWIGAQLARALDHAHGKGVLHRDVKPANVLLDARGVPKLVDFNVSFCSEIEGATPAAFFGGSLAYMSPEQLEACNSEHQRSPDQLDGRSDIYSLGVMLWELLTGERPFGDEEFAKDWVNTLEQMSRRRHESSPASYQGRLPDHAPPGLKEVLHRSLAADVERRWQRGNDLAGELELCLRPQARALLHAPSYGWKRAFRKRPVLMILLVTLVPNMLAGMFNFAYNHREIIANLGSASAQAAFWNTQLFINAIAFPGGLICVGYFAWPVAQRLRRGASATVSATSARRRSLRLGHYVAAVGIVEWLIAGIAYPLTIHILSGDLPAAAYLHFLWSMAICGLIAAAYPFFGVTWLATHIFFPAMLRGERADEAEPASGADRAELQALRRRTNPYLAVAAAVPMMGVGLLVIIGSSNRLALGVLSGVGIVGFGAAFWMYRSIQHALDLLESIVEVHPTSSDGDGSS
ncbi:MAG: serine/threonine-protein kinase [Pirellulales bacterium]